MIDAEKSLVSVIIPTYNRQAMLLRAIESVQKQTYDNLEIIIVDDASIDSTPDVVQSILDNRVHYLRSQQNHGGAETRNIGIRYASGEYIAFLDDDDIYLPNKIELLVSALKKSEAGIGLAYSKTQIVSGGHIIAESPRKGQSGDIFYPFLGGEWFHTNSTLIKRSAIREFDPVLRRFQDVDLHLKILAAHQALFVDVVTSIAFDDNHERISDNYTALLDAKTIFESRYFIELDNPQVRKAYGRFLSQVARRLLSNCTPRKQVLETFSQSMRYNPNLVTAADLMLSILGTDSFELAHSVVRNWKNRHR